MRPGEFARVRNLDLENLRTPPFRARALEGAPYESHDLLRDEFRETKDHRENSIRKDDDIYIARLEDLMRRALKSLREVETDLRSGPRDYDAGNNSGQGA